MNREMYYHLHHVERLEQFQLQAAVAWNREKARRKLAIKQAHRWYHVRRALAVVTASERELLASIVRRESR